MVPYDTQFYPSSPPLEIRVQPRVALEGLEGPVLAVPVPPEYEMTCCSPQLVGYSYLTNDSQASSTNISTKPFIYIGESRSNHLDHAHSNTFHQVLKGKVSIIASQFYG